MTILFPELRALPAERRAEALLAARKLPYDAWELLGIGAGLILASLFLEYAVDRAAAPVVRLVAAMAVATASIGPFVLRRMRRGLRRALDAA